MLFSTVFGIDANGKISEEEVKKLPRENLKILGRHIDAPHGPVVDEGETKLETHLHDTKDEF